MGSLATGAFDRREAGPLGPGAFAHHSRSLGLQVEWLWDGVVTAEGIDEQLAAFAAAGIGEVVIEAWDGIVAGTEPGVSSGAPFLSPAYVDLVVHAVAIAGRLGLSIWIYDGNAAGDDTGAVQRVLVRRPDLAATVVERVDGSLRRRPVPGALDRLSAEATEAVLAEEHQRIHDALGPELRSTVRGFWKDEPRTPRGVPWTEALPARFRDRWGYDLDDAVLHSVFAGGTSNDRRHRVAFWSTVAALFGAEHLGTVQRWHQDRGWLSLVQPIDDGLIFDVQTRAMGSMPVIQAWADVPGCDMWPGMWTDQALSDDFGGGLAHVLAASFAHLHGRARVQAEPYGLQGWGLEIAQQKSLADRLYARGINLISPAVTHYAYSVSQATFAGDFGPLNGPLWSFTDLLQTHLCRLGEVLAGAAHVAPFALLHPQTSAWAGDPEVETDVALQIATRNVGAALQLTHRGFDIVNEEVLADAATAVVDGTIVRHDHGFRTVVLPSTTTLFPTTLDVLEELVDGGGHVVFAGDRPTQCALGDDDRLVDRVTRLLGSPGVHHVGLPAVVADGLGELTDLVAALDACGPAEVVIDDPAPLGRVTAHDCYHARRGDDDVFFITNHPEHGHVIGGSPTGHWLRSWVHLDAADGVPELWDAETGEIGPLPFRATRAGVSVWLEIPSLGCALVVVRADTGKAPTVREDPTWCATTTLAGEFTVAFAPASLPIAVARPADLATGYGDLAPSAAGFSGTATYGTTITIATDGLARIDLGEARDCVEVSIDGKVVGRRAWPPFVFTIGALSTGQHRLDVSVTNTAANVMPGPDHDPLKPWGLYGPITVSEGGS